MSEISQWISALFQNSVALMTGTIIAVILSILSFLMGMVLTREALPAWLAWLASRLYWMFLGVAVITFLWANFLAWRVEHRDRVSAESRVETQGDIQRVYPWLRYAYGLEGYDGSSSDAGNRDRVLRPPILAMRLHFDRYSKDNPAVLSLGVRNDNARAPIAGVVLTVYFADKGVEVTTTGVWVSNLKNYEYAAGFQIISAQREHNVDGTLRVVFPRRGNYTIRIVINALQLGQSVYELPVVLE